MTRRSSSALSAVVGYDLALVSALPAQAGQELGLVAGAWCWATLGLALPVGYAFWLLTHVAWLSLASAGATGLLVLQLVRLTVAGGGIPASAERALARTHRPSMTPIFGLALLGLLFAQPAQLPLWRTEHRALVLEQRAQLLAQHQRALASLHATLPELSPNRSDNFARELADNEFVVLRLCSIWQSPRRATRYSLMYLALLLGPIVFLRWQASGAIRLYERRKLAQARALVEADRRRTQQTVERLLTPFASYLGSTPARKVGS